MRRVDRHTGRRPSGAARPRRGNVSPLAWAVVLAVVLAGGGDLAAAADASVTVADPAPNPSGRIGDSLTLTPEWLIAGSVTRRLTLRPPPAGPGVISAGAITLWPRDSAGVPIDTPISFTPATLKRMQRFGASMAVAGDLLFVGAPGWDAGTSPSVFASGKVFVVDLSLGSPVESGSMVPSPATVNLDFGAALAARQLTTGPRVVVGIPGYGTLSYGRVQMFTLVGTEWKVLRTWTNAPNVPLARYGSAVGLNGTHVVIGAPGSGAAVWGRVWIRTAPGPDEVPGGDGTTEGTDPPIELTAPSPTLGDRFGAALGVTDDLLVVGAPAGECDAGAAHIFRRTGGVWTFEASLTPPTESDPELDGWLGFGSSVSIERERVVVGSGAVGSDLRLGYRAAIYRHGPGGWTLETTVDGAAQSPEHSSAAGMVAIDSAGVAFTLPFGGPRAAGAVRFESQPRSPDLDFDGLVGPADLAALLGAWGEGGPADLNADGAVDARDLALLIEAWS
jgi:hypothetical protein